MDLISLKDISNQFKINNQIYQIQINGDESKSEEIAKNLIASMTK